MENVLQGKVQKKKLADDFDFDDSNCSKVHEERFKKLKERLESEGNLEDEILQEILKEKEEKMKKDEAAKKSKKRKAKKNEL